MTFHDLNVQCFGKWNIIFPTATSCDGRASAKIPKAQQSLYFSLTLCINLLIWGQDSIALSFFHFQARKTGVFLVFWLSVEQFWKCHRKWMNCNHDSYCALSKQSAYAKTWALNFRYRLIVQTCLRMRISGMESVEDLFKIDDRKNSNFADDLHRENISTKSARL